MRDENYHGAEANPDHDGGIRTAVHMWFADPAVAKAKYGPIASWDTSGVTAMFALFCDMEDFNEDISCWNVSNVWHMQWHMDLAYGSRCISCCVIWNVDISCWNVSNVWHMDLHSPAFVSQACRRLYAVLCRACGRGDER